MNINIKTFNNWAIQNKDEGMEKGHTSSVKKMFEIISSESSVIKKSFNFLDLGCGNGWVVRKVLNNKNCNYALGIDGAPEMIKKAKSIDKKGDYINTDIEYWSFNKSYDIIFSMETFYYFSSLDSILKNTYNNLKKNGMIIIGVDHYLENKPSLSWDKEFNLSLNTLSIDEWVSKFKINGFKDVHYIVHDKKEDWNGTLILYAKK